MAHIIPKQAILKIIWKYFHKDLINIFLKYGNIIALGDFNPEMSNIHLQEFCAIFSLTSLIKESTCFKNLEKETGLD